MIFINLNNKHISFSYYEKEYKLMIDVSSYLNNDALYIGLFDLDSKEPYSDVTINLNGEQLNYNQAFIDPINEDIGMVKRLIELEIISSIDNRKNYNYGNYLLVTFNMEKLKEYDKIGVKNFLELKKDVSTEFELLRDCLVKNDMDFRTKSGYYLHFHPNDEGYDFSYYDKDKILIDGGILLSDDYLTLSEVLTGISGLISRESLDESLKDLLKEDGLEMLHETIEEKIKI